MTSRMYKPSIFREIYRSAPILHKIRFYVNFKKTLLTDRLNPLSYRKENSLAIAALSKRRKEYCISSLRDEPLGCALPEIDLSIVTFNSADWIPRFITSLLNQNYPLEKINLYVIDHESTDKTLDVFKDLINLHRDKFLSVTVIQQPNLGFGAGHARAMKQGKSELCLISNVDIEYFPDSILNAVRAAQLDTAKQVASWEFRQIPYEHPKYYDPVTLETNWSSHACILIRRSAYEKVGGYDPMIFMYSEDVELSYRFRSYGYALKYIPKALVRHFTYKHKEEVKPNQFIGSTIGNIYLRTRYGDRIDIFIGIIIYFSLFFRPSRFKGEKHQLFSNILNFFKNLNHFTEGKGNAASFYPFRLFDYELRRSGAFFPCASAYNIKAPLVSIITRTYEGREAFLSQAINSVLNQTYSNIELIIVQDGGDSLRDFVDNFHTGPSNHVNIRFIPAPKQGRSHAGNRGLSASKGKYLMFLDDDDLLFADHIETLVNELEQNASASATYSLAMEVLTEINDVTKEYSEHPPFTPKVIQQKWDYEILLDHNFIPIQSLLFKRTLFEERGGFDTSIDQLEDWNLWLRYGFSNNFTFIEKTTSLYRSPANFSQRYARSVKLFNHYTEARNKALSEITLIINRR